MAILFRLCLTFLNISQINFLDWLAKEQWELNSNAMSVLGNADVIIDGDE